MAFKYRKYVAAIVFIKTKKGPRFLLLHRKQNWSGWEYVKGGLLPGEFELKGLYRELKEETGAKKFRIIAHPAFKVKYLWPKTFIKDHHRWHGAIQSIYLVEIFSKKIKLDKKEHDDYKWVTAKTALKLLTYPEAKRALRNTLKNFKIR